MAKQQVESYENNPFFIGLNGLALFFKNAKSVAIYAIVLSVLALVLNGVRYVTDVFGGVDNSKGHALQQNRAYHQAASDFFAQNPGQLAVAGIIVASIIFLVILVMLLLNGVLEYTGARLALGERVGLKQAFAEVAKELAGYLWVNILMVVKIFLWSLLFIVPGIIMAVRYKLAGTVFFAEGKRGNAAIQRSAELTKGAWFTTQAGYGLWNLITFNQINALTSPGASAILYRQLRDVTDAGERKPAAHWLSWLTFFVPIALTVMLLSLLVLLFIALAPSL